MENDDFSQLWFEMLRIIAALILLVVAIAAILIGLI